MQDESSSRRATASIPNGSQSALPLAGLALVAIVVVCATLFRGTSRNEDRGSRRDAAPSASQLDSTGMGRGAPQALAPFVPGARKQSRAELFEAAIRRALEKQINIDFADLPLEDAIQEIGQKLEIPVFIDRQSVTDEGVALDQPITLQQTGITGRWALKMLLEPIQLTWVIDDETMQITTSFRGKEIVLTRVYEVGDLVAVQDLNGKSWTDFTPLIDLLLETIEPSSWEQFGGAGSVSEFSSGGIDVICVRQTWNTHEEIAAFLAELRKQRRPGAVTIRSKLPDETRGPRSKRALATTNRFHHPRIDALVRGNNQFALQLYAKLAGETTGNVLVSPYSISLALAMVYSGARTETAREIAETMHFLLRQDDVPAAFEAMQRAMLSSDGQAIETANRFWGQNGVVFLEAFRERLQLQFSGGLEQLDFADSDSAARIVNSWISQSTRGLISEAVSPRDISPESRFLVTTAICFNGKWSVPFRRDATERVPFSTGAAAVEVPMMYLDTGTYQYAAIDDLQILEKPYGAGEYSMVILLPQNGPRALSALESTLTEASLVKWLGAQSLETLQLYLPRFKLQTGYELRGVLEALGLRRAFNPSAADFSGICTTENLALDKVIHKAFAEVDELGTRTAAATAVGGSMGGPPSEPPVVRVDHPFIFLIRDNRTGGILFIGRVVNPAAA